MDRQSLAFKLEAPPNNEVRKLGALTLGAGTFPKPSLVENVLIDWGRYLFCKMDCLS